MLIPERQNLILNYLKDHHFASVSELSQLLFVSETSIRRDLSCMEKSGLLQKTYGGAILVQGSSDVPALNARMETSKAEKTCIAKKAASIIADGSTIFLDSSSTALYMVPFLGEKQKLSVITNGARLAVSLAEYPHIRVYCSGGCLSPHIFSYNGAIAQQMLNEMHADFSFISIKALDSISGAFCANEEETQIRRIMLKNSHTHVLLCSARKLSKTSTFHLCNLDEVDYIVMDTSPQDEILQSLSGYCKIL